VENPFLLSPKKRLENWKIMRSDLSKRSELDQIKIVNDYWSKAPIQNFAYDPEHPETWTTPWEMIVEGNWCRFSIAIGMEFTLRLSGWDSNRLTLIYLNNYKDHILSFILDIDNSYHLNYEYDRIHFLNLNNPEFNIINKVKFDGKYKNILL